MSLVDIKFFLQKLTILIITKYSKNISKQTILVNYHDSIFVNFLFICLQNLVPTFIINGKRKKIRSYNSHKIPPKSLVTSPIGWSDSLNSNMTHLPCASNQTSLTLSFSCSISPCSSFNQNTYT